MLERINATVVATKNKYHEMKKTVQNSINKAYANSHHAVKEIVNTSSKKYKAITAKAMGINNANFLPGKKTDVAKLCDSVTEDAANAMAEQAVLAQEEMVLAEINLMRGATTAALNGTFTAAATQALDVKHANKIVKNNHDVCWSKGLGLNLGFAAFRSAVLFCGMELLEPKLKATGIEDDKIKIAAFGVANIVEAVVWAPILVARIRYMTTKSETLVDLCKSTHWQEFAKTSAYAAGLGALRNILFALPYMYMLRVSEKNIFDKNDVSLSMAGKKFVIGGVAGTFAALPGYPVDFVMRKFINNPSLYNACDKYKYVRRVYKIKGMTAFYYGFGLAAFRMFVASGAMNAAMYGGSILCDKFHDFDKSKKNDLAREKIPYRSEEECREAVRRAII